MVLQKDNSINQGKYIDSWFSKPINNKGGLKIENKPTIIEKPDVNNRISKAHIKAVCDLAPNCTIKNVIEASLTPKPKGIIDSIANKYGIP